MLVGSWLLSGLGSGLCLLTSTKVLLLNMWQRWKVWGEHYPSIVAETSLPYFCLWESFGAEMDQDSNTGGFSTGQGITLGRHFTFCASFLIRKPGVCICQACCCVNSSSAVLAADSAEELRASAERWCSWLGADCGPCQNPSFQIGSVSVGHPHVLSHLNLARFCGVTWLVPFYRQGWALQRARMTVPV